CTLALLALLGAATASPSIPRPISHSGRLLIPATTPGSAPAHGNCLVHKKPESQDTVVHLQLRCIVELLSVDPGRLVFQLGRILVHHPFHGHHAHTQYDGNHVDHDDTQDDPKVHPCAVLARRAQHQSL
ncbi:hypothetical protein B0H10DRAFT_2192476, partial [Mycena sp. CBHHK59/15]